jgi:hypothetical protein
MDHACEPGTWLGEHRRESLRIGGGKLHGQAEVRPLAQHPEHPPDDVDSTVTGSHPHRVSGVEHTGVEVRIRRHEGVGDIGSEQGGGGQGRTHDNLSAVRRIWAVHRAPRGVGRNRYWR